MDYFKIKIIKKTWMPRFDADPTPGACTLVRQEAFSLARFSPPRFAPALDVTSFQRGVVLCAVWKTTGQKHGIK